MFSLPVILTPPVVPAGLFGYGPHCILPSVQSMAGSIPTPTLFLQHDTSHFPESIPDFLSTYRTREILYQPTQSLENTYQSIIFLK